MRLDILKKYNKVMSFKIYLISLILSISVLVSCKNDQVIKQDGVIVVDSPDFFQFIPVKHLNLDSSISSFYTKNLETGIMFSTHNRIGGLYDTVFINIDTFHLEYYGKNPDIESSVLKIEPVHIEYTLDEYSPKYTNNLGIYRVKNRTVKFIVKYGEFNISKIIPYKYKNKNKKGSYFESLQICPPHP